jgi:TPR repeat protein
MSDDNATSRAIEEFEKKNYSAAFELLRPLAHGGNPRAQLCLANLYHLGLGVAADAEKAVALYLSVANRNIREGDVSGLAYNNLGSLYMAGAPKVRADRELATRYYALARELGFPAPG